MLDSFLNAEAKSWRSQQAVSFPHSKSSRFPLVPGVTEQDAHARNGRDSLMSVWGISRGGERPRQTVAGLEESRSVADGSLRLGAPYSRVLRYTSTAVVDNDLLDRMANVQR